MNYRSRILSVIDRQLPSPDVLYTARGQTGDFGDAGPTDMPEKPLTLAAVLVPVVEYDPEPKILLTRRADHLAKHSGQVAFPGGKVEAQDDTPVATALRETHEEVGLDPTHVEIAGFLDTYETGTGFRVLPVVGFVRPGFTLQPDENEVADVFEVPVSLLFNHENYQAHDIVWEGRQRQYYSMDYQGFNIWGATAGMLHHFGRRMAK
jgi:8-oxo-dGTP pyrophosphatase MutT (NUDIX family)